MHGPGIGTFALPMPVTGSGKDFQHPRLELGKRHRQRLVPCDSGGCPRLCALHEFHIEAHPAIFEGIPDSLVVRVSLDVQTA
ncbi:MAG TPA: hypothetical protein VFO71_09340 [Gemmatimonadales bacterium]|nr:hypothetical protein [Gemmatimonadales bacterium]